jgi:argininosuccinate lyase
MSILRGKRLKDQPLEIAKFTSSANTDQRIVEHVISINIAHTLSLLREGAIPRSDGVKCLKALLSLDPQKIDIAVSDEDVHVTIERLVSELAGPSGGFLNLAKSRNDQVATALRMEARRALANIALELCDLISALLTKAKAEQNSLMPYYTHLQRAQPTTVAHVLLAHAHALERDLERTFFVLKNVNLCPMGAAAGCGSTIKIDRKRIAKILAFDGVLQNTIDAVATRDFVLDAIFVASSIMSNLSVLCEHLILWSTKEFNFVRLSDEHVSTSSAMPHKRNPVVPEIIRAKSSQVVGKLIAAFSIVNALPYGYNLDLQELNALLFDTFDVTQQSLKIATQLVQKLEFLKESLDRATKDHSLCSTDLAEWLCVEKKIPYREAYHYVGDAIVHGDLKADKEQTLSVLDPQKSVQKRATEGGPSKLSTTFQIRALSAKIFKVKRRIFVKLKIFDEVPLKISQEAKKEVMNFDS